MKIEEGFSVGLTAIRVNKMRSLLTMLGIIIGVASVLAMIAVGDGAKALVLQDVEKIGGANQFSLYRSSWIRKGKGRRWERNRSNEYFEYDDVLAIEAECPSVEGIIPRIPAWGGVLIRTADGAEKRTGYEGITPFYKIGMNWDVQEGRFISEEDITNRRKVSVIGSELATDLFGEQDPIGKEIKVSRGSGGRGESRGGETSVERFTIVGVMTPRGRSLRYGWNLDDRVLLPLTTVQERFTGNDRVTMLTVQAKSVDLIDKATEEVKAVLKKRHRNQDDFFNLWTMKDGMEQMFKISRIIKIMLGGIAGFSLLVGGIGIMNMMLVSVTERTREIGLRKAIGAKRKDVLFQFLVEAIAMCSVGGLLGIGLGVGAGYGMAHVATKIVKIIDHWPSTISVQWMIISFSFSAAIGIFFGLYPAIKAAQLSPIEALRTE